MNAITDFISHHLDTMKKPELNRVAQEILNKHAHSDITAIVSYGSLLRGTQISDSPADFFVFVSHYCRFHVRWFSALANYILPPHVYFLQPSYKERIYQAKYNIVTVKDINNWTNQGSTPFFWIRLCQPCCLNYCLNSDNQRILIQKFAKAHQTAYAFARRLPEYNALNEAQKRDPLLIWKILFRCSYGLELRNEKRERIDRIVDNWKEYYTYITPILEQDFEERHMQYPLSILTNFQLSWLRKRTKTISFLRVCKARFTSGVGLSYLIWKLQRHSTTTITLKPWQQKYRLVAKIVTIVKLYLQTRSR